MTLAFIGGLVFKGRSGWCGTFCPIGPIQRTYGHAPLVNVPNSYCPTCVGCQKNCYDLNPKGAIFADLHDEDPRYAGQHRSLMAMLPGIVTGYFMQMPYAGDYPTFLMLYAFAMVLSLGAYQFVNGFIGVPVYKTCAAFASVALCLFYFFAAPIIAHSVATLSGSETNALIALSIRIAAIIAATALLVKGFLSEQVFENARRKNAVSKNAVAAAYSVTDKDSGKVIETGTDQSLLTALLAARLPVNASCGSGLCGSDAVLIVDGAQNLSPPTEDETATLRRLGLEGVARLACSCRVKGPVVIQRDLSQRTAAGAKPTDLKTRTEFAIRAHSRRKISQEPRNARDVVIIGNGIAGVTVAQVLKEETRGPWRVTLVTNEPYAFYNRMALAKVITNKLAPAEATLVPEAWYRDNDINVLLNTRVAEIDRSDGKITTIKGTAIAYDKLVVATGSRAVQPSPLFLAHENCFVLRNLSDAIAIRTFLQKNPIERALVLGGGVLGVETAEALARAGVRTTLIHRGPALMNRELAAEASDLLIDYLTKLGIEVRTDTAVASFHGGIRLQAVRTTAGDEIDAEIVISCLGVTPSTELAEACGLEIGRGLKIDERMQTSDPDIFSVGDVAESKQGLSGLWQNAINQARIAAMAIAGRSHEVPPYRPILRLKSDGVDLLSFGTFSAGDASREIITAPKFSAGWWRLEVVLGRIESANYVGAPESGKYLESVIKAQQDVEAILPSLRSGKLDLLKQLAV